LEIAVTVGDISRFEANAIIVNLFEGTEDLSGDLAAIDAALDGGISRLIAQGEIKGKLGENTFVHTLAKLPAGRVMVAGLGKEADLTQDKVRGAVAGTCRMLRDKNVKSIATVAQGAGASGITYEAAAQAIAEGALLGLYTFRRHITKESEHGEIERLTIVEADQSNTTALEQGSLKGEIQ